MGSSASKSAAGAAAKHFPTTPSAAERVKFTPPPTSFPARPSPPPSSYASPSSSISSPTPATDPTSPVGSQRQAPFAAESKTDAIERDGGRDPDFLSSLSALGQVTVPRSQHAFKQNNAFVDLLQQRKRDTAAISAELGASQRPKNRLEAGELLQLLSRRKYARTPDEVFALCEEFNIDVEVLERLGRWVNTVDADYANTVVVNGQEKAVAYWRDPILPRRNFDHVARRERQIDDQAPSTGGASSTPTSS